MDNSKIYIKIMALLSVFLMFAVFGAVKANAGICDSGGVSSCDSGPYTFEQNGQVCGEPIGYNSGNVCSSNSYCVSNTTYPSQTCWASSGTGCKCMLSGGVNDIAIGSCCQSLNPLAYATPETANAMAACLGATVQKNQQDNAYGYWSVPEYNLIFSSGAILNAGAVANTYMRNTKANADQSIAYEACRTSSTGGGTSGTSSGRTGTTGTTGAGTSGTVNLSSSQIAYIQSLTNIVNNLIQTYKNMLNPGSTQATGATLDQASYVQNLTNIVNNLTQTYKSALNSIGTTPANTNTTPAVTSAAGKIITTFPATVTVNIGTLNYRSGPNTTSAVLGQYHLGDTFTATGAVAGENVNGENRWWKTAGAYVWSGGTAEKPGTLTTDQSSGTTASSTSGAMVTLTANGQTNISVYSGDPVTYSWTSPPIGVNWSFSSSYTADGADTCVGGVSYAGEIKPWVITTTNGSTTQTIQPCQAGRTYTITFRASNMIEQGTAVITVKVLPGTR